MKSLSLKRVILDTFQVNIDQLTSASRAIKNAGGDASEANCCIIVTHEALSLFREGKLDDAGNKLIEAANKYNFSNVATLGVLIKKYIMEKHPCSEFIQKYCYNSDKCESCSTFLKDEMERLEDKTKDVLHPSCIKAAAHMIYNAHNDGNWPDY